jgi:5-methylthioadenosine/S-adenosylhomocysteine deaminase
LHGVHLTTDEVELLARHGSSVVHCPSSNLKLASWLRAGRAAARGGVNVALGTDGAPATTGSTDAGDAPGGASREGGGTRRGSDACASRVRCATLGGAIALGLERRIGSITPASSQTW